MGDPVIDFRDMERYPDFNWKEYIRLNPDLKNGDFDTEEKAASHWLLHGCKEGRIYSRSMVPKVDLKEIKRYQGFGWKEYIRLNPDLKPRDFNTSEKAIIHWLVHGRKEGRVYKSPGFDLKEIKKYSGFDWKEYIRLNPDLKPGDFNTSEKAIIHWLVYGRKEGRIYSRSMIPKVDLKEIGQYPGFDWKEYIRLNSDLKPGDFNTPKKAIIHWLVYGRKEGRIYSRSMVPKVDLKEIGKYSGFDWREYIRLNPDLKPGDFNTSEKAITHWLVYGRKEGRIYSRSTLPNVDLKEIGQYPGFDWKEYIRLNSDLKPSDFDTRDKVVTHWLLYGRKEGRIYSRSTLSNVDLKEIGQYPGFDWKEYIRLNPDLKVGKVDTKDKAISHWLLCGRKEGRIYIRSKPLKVNLKDMKRYPDFNWKEYVSLNPDLGASGIDTKEKAISHWLLDGCKEGRVYARLKELKIDLKEIGKYPGFDWKEYIRLNPDLKDGKVDTKDKAISHWLLHGRQEGRVFKASTKRIGKNASLWQTPSPRKKERVGILKKKTVVNVIVPVFLNYQVTRECLERLIRAKQHYPYTITVINDKSPEPAIHSYLNTLSALGKISLIEHKVNQGFVRSVIEGMRFNEMADVVLLNSYVYVSDYCLDFLRDAVYKEKGIATGTPLGSKATIFSYPTDSLEGQQSSSDISVDVLAPICRKVNRNISVKVPTGHGFCLFIRRDALKEVGYFDEATWQRGYGEEVDWCQRALKRGWRHIAVADVFVEHVEGQSFLDKKSLLVSRANQLIANKYPYYDSSIHQFIEQDPLAQVRKNIDWERLKHHDNQFVLIIAHDLGGGTEEYLKDLTYLLELEKLTCLVLRPDSKSKDSVRLTCSQLDVLIRYNINSDLRLLVKDIKQLKMVFVHVSHTIGFPVNFVRNFLRALGLEYYVTIHDYVFVCPRVTLSQGRGVYCQEPPVDECEACLEKYGAYSALHYPMNDGIVVWRAHAEEFLREARKVFVPTQDVARRMARYFPRQKFVVKAHPEVIKKVVISSQNDCEKAIRVGIIGGISEIKGLNVLHDCAAYALENKIGIKFIVIGEASDERRFDDLPNVSILGKYKRNELSDLIVVSKLDFFAVMSVWPETYCYVLSEGLRGGLYPFAFDIGALGERIRSLKTGCLIRPDISIESLVGALHKFGLSCRKRKMNVVIGNAYRGPFLKSYYERK